ncbi:unnamed protein product [Symbiodinium sp. CCMP2592]|nr:unnamed protein product [Symbiodinium sp. CCMP2592]
MAPLLVQAVMKLSLVCMVAVTVLCLVRSGEAEDLDPRAGPQATEEYERLRFKEDSPLVLYLATVEMLICGSCAATAAAMYSRQGHQLRHPAEQEQSALFTKVELCKDPGLEDCQLYGLGFRPSSDGLECLVVEDIRRGSLLDRWNHRSHDLSPEELVEQALGEEHAGGGEGASPQTRRATPAKVALGSAVVAVNDVYADVGLMQQQLTKPHVTLWVRREDDGLHPSELDAGVFGAEVPPVATTAGPVSTLGAVEEGIGFPVWCGAGASASDVGACLAMEDEEAQILMRWTVCGIMFGWVTLLPVLLMQPHEERCGAESAAFSALCFAVSPPPASAILCSRFHVFRLRFETTFRPQLRAFRMGGGPIPPLHFHCHCAGRGQARWRVSSYLNTDPMVVCDLMS